MDSPRGEDDTLNIAAHEMYDKKPTTDALVDTSQKETSAQRKAQFKNITVLGMSLQDNLPPGELAKHEGESGILLNKKCHA